MKITGLLVSGSLIPLIGIGHIFFPVYGYDGTVQAFFRQSPPIADHFYYLATWAICNFLLFMGITTIYIGWSAKLRIQSPGFIRFFCLLSAVLWLLRLLLELRYPVQLSLFGIAAPTNNLIIVLSIIVAGFVLAWYQVRERQPAK